MEGNEADREARLRELASELFFTLKTEGSRFALYRNVDVPKPVRHEGLTLAEVEDILNTWKLRGPHTVADASHLSASGPEGAEEVRVSSCIARDVDWRSHAARSSRFRSTASYRDRKDIAIAAAEYLKRKFPHSDVVVKHLPSGEVTVAAYKPDDERPTGDHSPVYAKRQDWTIFDGGKLVGRIYEDASASTPADLRWFWSVIVYVDPRDYVCSQGVIRTE